MTSIEAGQSLDSALLGMQSEALQNGQSATPLHTTRAWRLVRTHAITRHRLGDASAVTLTLVRLRTMSRWRRRLVKKTKRDESVRHALARLARELRATARSIQ